MAGITSTGLEIKRLNQVREGLRQQASEIFSDLVPTGDVLDTGSGSTLGRLIGVVSLGEAELWEAIQDVYSAFDPNSAEGIALDNLVALSGLIRKGEQASTARMLFRGDYNTTITRNSLVSSSFTNYRFVVPQSITLNNEDVVGVVIDTQLVQNSTDYVVTYSDDNNTVNLTYTSTASATRLGILQGLADTINNNIGSILTAEVVGNTLEIIADDKVTESTYSLSSNLYYVKSIKGLTVVAEEAGPKEQDTGTIDTITTPILGLDSVEQIAPATVGSLRETDAQLRRRFTEAKYLRGSNILDALQSELLSLDGVQDVRIYENLTDTTDAKGLPAHSFRVLIRGGIRDEIGDAIWRNKPAGIATSGNISVVIDNILGDQTLVYFERPEFIDLYVSVTITTDDEFPSDGPERIKAALSQYITEQTRLGEDLRYSRLYTPINSVPGHFVDQLFIDTSPSPASTSNISINYDQLLKLELGNIEVNVT